jgi:glycosyltransferase involved in cell wall biosynthesis
MGSGLHAVSNAVSSGQRYDCMLTIGIPTRNRAATVGRLVETCLGQTRPPRRIVVSDNASDDDTFARLREFDDSSLKIIRQSEPLSMAANWNACLRQAESEWFTLLPDDDRIAVDFVENVERALAAAPDADLVIMRCRIVDEQTGRIDENSPPVSCGGRIVFADSLLSSWLEGSFSLPLAGMVFRRCRLEAVGGFSNGFSYAVDAATWLPIAMRGPCAFWPEAKAEYVVHSGMTTHQYALETLIDESIRLAALVAREVEESDLDDAKKRHLLQLSRQFVRRIFAENMILAARQRDSKRELLRAWARTARSLPRFGVSGLALAALAVPRGWMDLVGMPYRKWTQWRQARHGAVTSPPKRDAGQATAGVSSDSGTPGGK